MPTQPSPPASDESSHGSPFPITGARIAPWELEQIARFGRPIKLDERALERLERSNRTLKDAIGKGVALYGVNTGFGSLARQRVPDHELADVQRNLLRSHAAGAGDPLPDEIVRGMLTLLACSLSRGHSGVRPVVVQTLVDLVNAGITPLVPESGSVGASGDLAPLAHACLALIGEGKVRYRGRVCSASEALTESGINPIELGPKEGLALINGTHLMAARGALTLVGIRRLIDAAICAAAMSIDAVRATDSFLDARVHQIRQQPGQRSVAARLRDLLRGSQIIPAHRDDDPRVQDPYSFRCTPQVLGAAIDQLEHAARTIERELEAVTDNPLIFETTEEAPEARTVVSAGNFHGMPLAIALDTVAIALCHIAGMAERRVYYMLAASDPQNPINPHLSRHPGVESGYMITQYTAAACCNEMITLATPASVSNISTCAGMEDYNSFGPRAAAKAERSMQLCRSVVAIELLCAAEALEYQRPLRSGAGVERAFETIRTVVPRLHEDRPPAPDIRAIEELILAGRFG
ncbi:MAG: histidine ammonia-lyase [Phycisphaerales bacterium JB050]